MCVLGRGGALSFSLPASPPHSLLLPPGSSPRSPGSPPAPPLAPRALLDCSPVFASPAPGPPPPPNSVDYVCTEFKAPGYTRSPRSGVLVFADFCLDFCVPPRVPPLLSSLLSPSSSSARFPPPRPPPPRDSEAGTRALFLPSPPPPTPWVVLPLSSKHLLE